MSEEEVHFEKLTPINDCKLGIYEKAMDFIFSDQDIVNVAVTGPYASGKSSMIESYKKINSDKKFLHISLAHFNKNSKEEKQESDEEDNFKKENRLEGKIINQLIHKIESKFIPQTNFNIKEKIEKKDIARKTIVSGICIVLFLYIAYYNFWYITVSNMNNSILKSILKISLNNEVLLVSGCICIGIISYCIYKSIENQRFNKYLKKLKIQGNEIEVFGDNEESYFDKYLNEVLYLFKNSEVDAIVFEDIDRYDSRLIFEKLREISILVNSRCNINMKFIYLLKDDMFTSKDRTKFFDYIIPIVPVVDSSNSYDKFIEHFEKGKIFNLLDENFLKDISLYVDDMRLLKNIYNEFYIYYNKLEKDNSKQSDSEKIKLDKNKLLGMIVYKNIFPKDFSDLQLGQGFVYCVLKSRENAISKEMEEINREIELLEQENEDINKEQLNSVDELDACYAILNGGEVQVNSKEEYEYKSRLEFIKALKKNNYICQQYNHGWRERDFRSVFNELEKNQEYKKKKLLITNKFNNKIQSNNEKLKKLKENCANLKGKYMKDIINRKNEEEIFKINHQNEIGEKREFKEIKGSIYFPLIKYLIRNGYINENYSDYMTYFYPNSLTYSDKAFLLSVANRNANKEYSCKLINCKLILSRLRLSDFLEKEILNYDLLSYLLENSREYKEQLENFLANIKDNKIIDFVSTMFNKENNEDDKILFVKEFNSEWGEACYWIISEEKFDQKIKREYIQKTILYSEYDDIEENNFELHTDYDYDFEVITHYINQDYEFLSMEVQNIRLAIEKLKLIKVEMEYIDYDKSNKELFFEVYRNELYEINYNMITLILEKIYNIPRSDDDFKEKNYSLIMFKKDEPLVEYINKNIEDYIRVILDEKPKRITDELKYALMIINNSELDGDLRNNYIELLQTNIEKLKDIDDKELWGMLIEKDIVDNTDENLLDYYFEREKQMDDILIGFINNFKNDFNFKSDLIEESYGKDADDKLFTSIIICNEINDKKYLKLLQRFDRYYEVFNISNINKSKISMLIELQIIRMNADTLTFMRNNYKDNLIEYILINIDKYLNETLDEDNFKYDEMLKIIDQNIAEDKKTELLSFTEKAISIKNKGYSNKIKKYIIENNFDKSDVEYLINIFIDEDEDMKEIIKKIILKNINIVIEKEYSIGYELLSELIDNEKINEDDKRNLIILSMNALKNSEIYKCFKKLNMTDYMSIFNRKRPKFEVNDINERLLTALREKEIINKFDIDSEDDIDYYFANGKKLMDSKSGVVYDM